MLGARWGVSAIPLEWRRHIHGWPGLRDVDLLRLVWEANAGNPWPSSFDGHPSATGATAHPRDIGLWIDGTAGLRPLPPGIDAVVSLCPLGHEQTPRPPVAAEDHVNVWLIDSEDPAENPNLELVADQTLKMLLRLRSGQWTAAEVFETLRFGLIGGGMAPVDALKLCQRAFDRHPLIEFKVPALTVMMAALYGPADDPAGKDLPAGAETPSEPAIHPEGNATSQRIISEEARNTYSEGAVHPRTDIGGH